MSKTEVTIIVLTYNSEDFIIETLESIKNQTYDILELVISDDCSKDSTLKLCEEWALEEENRNKFTDVKILTHPQNTGISANCNRGLMAATGAWIKLIAGDDLLLPDCINSFMSFLVQVPSAEVMVSKLMTFKGIPDNILSTWPYKSVFPSKLKVQFKEQLKANFIKAPAVIIQTAMLKRLGGFNEDYPFLEDDPLWTKILSHGIKFYYIPKCLVAYRIHDKAVSNSTSINVRFLDSVMRYYNDIAIPLMQQNKMYFWIYLLKLEMRVWNDLIQTGGQKTSTTFRQKIIFSVVGWTKRLNLLFNSLA